MSEPELDIQECEYCGIEALTMLVSDDFDEYWGCAKCIKQFFESYEYES